MPGLIYPTIYTLGHSTMPQSDLIQLCRAYDVNVVVDIRSHPTSKWEWFRKESMERWLVDASIGYLLEPGLGGWTARHKDLQPAFTKYNVDLDAYSKGKFPKHRIAQDIVGDGPAWTNVGLWDYQFFMTLDEFREACMRLVNLARTPGDSLHHQPIRPAIMCAEVLWWKCHRSMVADYLANWGIPVVHLQPRPTEHTTTRLPRYHADVRSKWREWGAL